MAITLRARPAEPLASLGSCAKKIRQQRCTYSNSSSASTGAWSLGYFGTRFYEVTCQSGCLNRRKGARQIQVERRLKVLAFLFGRDDGSASLRFRKNFSARII